MTLIWNLGHLSYFGFCSGLTEKPTFSALLASVTALAAASCQFKSLLSCIADTLVQGCSIIIIIVITIIIFSFFCIHLSAFN